MKKYIHSLRTPNLAAWGALLLVAAGLQLDDDGSERIEGTGRIVRLRVVLAGDAPALPVIEVDKTREHCGDQLEDPILVVHKPTRGLANVVAWLECDLEETPTRSTPEPPDLELVTEGCLMHPRVQCARVGARISMGNQDEITHNPHGWGPDHRTTFNLTLFGQGTRIRRPLKQAGVMRVDCDTHSWMRAWIHVFDHPWYAQSHEDGLLEVPMPGPGPHQLHLWHEVLGHQVIQVDSTDAAEDPRVLEWQLVDLRPEDLVPPGQRPWMERGVTRDE